MTAATFVTVQSVFVKLSGKIDAFIGRVMLSDASDNCDSVRWSVCGQLFGQNKAR